MGGFLTYSKRFWTWNN